MKRHPLFYLAVSIILFGCGTDENNSENQKNESGTLTEVQTIAEDLCNCLKEMNWKKIETSGNQEQKIFMEELNPFIKCSFALRNKYNVDIMDGEEVKAEVKKRCSDLQGKMDKYKKWVSGG